MLNAVNNLHDSPKKLADEREKWEMEKQEKEQLLDETSLLREQVKEKENEVKALLEKQVLAVQEATQKLSSSHQEQIKDLTEKHQQEAKLKKRLEWSCIIFPLIYLYIFPSQMYRFLS